MEQRPLPPRHDRATSAVWTLHDRVESRPDTRLLPLFVGSGNDVARVRTALEHLGLSHDLVPQRVLRARQVVMIRIGSHYLGRARAAVRELGLQPHPLSDT